MRHDFQIALRRLLKSPGFTLVAVLTLGLSIGANSGTFSLAYFILWNRLPFEQATDVALVERVDAEGSSRVLPVADFENWRRHGSQLASLTLIDHSWQALLDDARGIPREVSGIRVSSQFFQTVDLEAGQGRLPSPATILESEPLVVLGLSAGRRFFGGREMAGQTIRVNGQPYLVEAVLAADFYFRGRTVDLILTESDFGAAERGFVVVRTKPGVSREAAAAELGPLTAPRSPELSTEIVLHPFEEILSPLRASLRARLVILFTTTALIFLLGWFNLTNLLEHRMLRRRHEIAVRGALGAGRKRLTSMLAWDGVLVTGVGALTSIPFLFWTLHLFRLIAPSDALTNDMPRLFQLGLFLAALAALSVLGFSFLFPARFLKRFDPRQWLATDGRTATGENQIGTSSGLLLGLQVAVSLICLSGASVLVANLNQATRLDLGFDPENVVLIDLPLSEDRFLVQGDEPVVSLEEEILIQRLLEELKHLPGVEAAAVARNLFDDSVIHYQPEGHPQGRIPFGAVYRPVSPDFFEVLGIRLLRGVGFSGLETVGNPPVAVVSTGLARGRWPGENAIGKRIRLSNEKIDRRVIGEVADTRPLTDFQDQRPFPSVFIPYRQQPREGALATTRLSPTIVVRVTRGTGADTLVGAIRNIDPRLASTPYLAEEVLNRQISETRFFLIVFASLTAAALFLAILGVYSVTAQSALRRTREIAIRRALGAAPVDIARILVSKVALMVTVGLVLGVGGVLALTRVLRTLWTDIDPQDPLLLAACGFLIAAVALTAAVIPTYRALRNEPLDSLRCE